MKRKKIILNDDIDFDLEDDDQDDDSSLDPLFQNYFEPDFDSSEAPDDETFIEAAEAQHRQMMGDFEQADDRIKVLTNTKSAVVSGVDTDYFFCVVFVSEEQKKAFIEASGWGQYGGARYLNGIEMARDMGIDLPPAYLATDAKPDKSLAEFTERSPSDGKRNTRSKRP